MRRSILTILLVLVALGVIGAIFITSGVYNVAADEEHTAAIGGLLATARERSIAVRASGLQVPDLADPARIRRGAGNYDAMCVECHLAPGRQETEVHRGLYPEPPELAEASTLDPARAFWVIKHGIKSTGMPAWGRSMEDQYIWDLVALLKQLPSMSAEQYVAEVRSSGGHSHGGGQGDEHEHQHEHAAGADDDHEHVAEEEAEESHEHSHDSSHEHAAHEQDASSLPAAPVAAVKAFHEALSAGDRDAVASLLDPEVLIMEGGNVERSRAEYAAHHLPEDLKFMSAVKYTLQRQSGDAIGDFAWVASEADLKGQAGGKPADLISTESLVLKKQPSGWRIVHIHWSSRSRSKP